MLRAIASVAGSPVALYESGIPFIGLSSGSVAANGAISGITALPIAYPAAYCWFPANALATTIAAGWYFCTFSGTTAGTAFLNTYTGDVPTIPASPTAVTDGKGAFVGVTTEIFGPAVNVPALGVNDRVQFSFLTRFTNSANAKATNVRFSGNAGTTIYTVSLTAQLGFSGEGEIWNRGATNVQTGVATTIDQGGIVRSEAPVATAVDTTAATTLVFSHLRAAATDNFIFDAVGVQRRSN